MKNIIVAILTLLIVILMVYLNINGTTFQGGEQGKIIQDIAKIVPKNSSKPKLNIEAKKLKTLQNKAGNIQSFKVSLMYKKRCASCHGINGEGIIGPKIIGQSSEVLYKKLLDYKAGRTENAVMKGLLLNLTKEELKTLADEIGRFGTN